MSDKVFIDTNILIYAHDKDAGRKRDAAAQVLLELWENKQGVLSTQVLQEFYVNVTRKIPTPISKDEARDIIDRYAVWTIIVIDPSLILRASRIEEEYRISFWDSLIVAAAEKADAKILFSEDLNAGQLIAGIQIENPLL
jgi:predicted nucleic acid-binding protein